MSLDNPERMLSSRRYAHENDDLLPRETPVDGINSWEMTGASTNRDVWYNALAETMLITPMEHYAQTPASQQEFYLNGKIFHCPRARFAPVSATYPNFSLAMNSKLMRDFGILSSRARRRESYARYLTTRGSGS